MKKKGEPVTVLVVDDDTSHRFMLKSMFTEWGWNVEEADDGTTAVAAVEEHSYDAILMDVRMAKMDGMEALRRIHAFNPAIPVVIMTAYSSVDSAVEAIKIGAHDYLTKPLDFERLRLTMARALDHRQVAEEKEGAKARQNREVDAAGIIGGSPVMEELLEMISFVAPTEATVLITGESGTGKELIATALHRNSVRNGKTVPLSRSTVPPWWKVCSNQNCSATIRGRSPGLIGGGTASLSRRTKGPCSSTRSARLRRPCR
jgi:two-component system response regulator HydG